MKIGLISVFRYSYSPLFWTLLFILCATFTQTEDVATKETPATIQENLSANYSDEAKTFVTPTPPAVANTASDESGTISANEEVNPHAGEDSNNLNSDSVQSSFSEDTTEGLVPPELGHAEAASQNAGIPNEISDAGQIVVTLIDSASADLQQRIEQSASSQEELPNNKNKTNSAEDVEAVASPTIPSEDNNTTTEGKQDEDEQQQKETKPLVEVPKIQGKENLTEEIPSFSEWAQKQLEEAEKKREEVNSSTHHNTNGKGTNNHKLRSKNYASPDCGAKIVAANPEAISPSSVLSPSRDEYKLNTCTSRIWFIVELCEAVQAKKIDLANFELFSSSPKDFSVYVSDRFPSREWSNVGQFTAKDERDVQSFDLHPHLFGKYIKVEMHSHHGSEHFCPISLFRVYGTSEFEVLEKEDQLHTAEDDDDDDTLDSEKRPGPKNLFSSATDAVISIVKKAAEVLGNKGNGSTSAETVETSKDTNKYSPLISTCTTPSHIVVCDNCSDLLFGQVFELLSCRSQQLQRLLEIKSIRSAISNTSVCVPFGLNFHAGQINRTEEVPNELANYVKSFFSTPYLAALCNTVAVLENKVVLNVSNQVNATDKELPAQSNNSAKLDQTDIATNEKVVAKNEESVDPTVTIPIANDPTQIATDTSHIKPTKTIAAEEVADQTAVHMNIPEIKTTEDVQQKDEQKSKEKETLDEKPEVTESVTETTDEPHVIESNEELEHLMDIDNNIIQNSATPAPPKESVFLRLSNRIKTLERNMSLSSQYLEELSRRYKKQVEEMQRLLEKTITALNEESKRKDERNDRLEAKLKQLTEVVEALVSERDNSFNPFHWLVLIVVSTVTIFTFCRRNDYKRLAAGVAVAEVQRRKSIDVVNHNTPVKKERRPSEEALKISGTYEHLLVDNAELPRRSKERKRKRKKGMMQRSNSITTLSEEHQNKDWNEEFTPSLVSSPSWNRQASAPAQSPTEWNVQKADCLDEAPIVLEESDNNPLQDMPLPKPLQEEKIVKINGNVGITPARKISSPAFLKAVEERITTNGYFDIVEKCSSCALRESTSADDTTREASPTPSSGNVSLNLDDNTKRRKEKKGTFKKIFKKVF